MMVKFYLNFRYFGRVREMLVKMSIKTLRKTIRKDVGVIYVVTFNTTKLSFYTNAKDRVDKFVLSCFLFQLFCPLYW